MSLPNHQLQLQLQRHTKSSAIYKIKCITLATQCLLFGSTAVVLSGCQSSSNSIQANSATTLIDFSASDNAQIQVQGRAFNASIATNAESHQQLFDQAKYPNNETQAKSRLLAAIRQHLATEHVAVAQARYQSVPFTDASSIDAGSSSLLRTIIELYAYRSQASEDYDLADAQAELAAAIADLEMAGEALEKCTEQDESEAQVCAEEIYDDSRYDGYNAEGYDGDGYDAKGYDYEGYGEYGYSTDDEEDSDTASSALSVLSMLNPKALLSDYEDMQAQKQQAAANKGNTKASSPFTGMVGTVLGMFQRSPEQTQVMNSYQYKNLTFNSVSQYKPAQKQLQSIYSYDYLTPTVSSSIQIPLALDFASNRITVDPSALMPLVAIINPKHAPLPQQMTAHTVDFGFPDVITSNLHPAVIYDAVIAAMQDSMAELAIENFSAVDISADQFAKQVGAERAVKVYLGSKQSGEMLGRMFKHISQSLEDYVVTNPDKYPDDAVLKTAITKIQLYNKGYQSADVGSLVQLIEAIGPISFNQTNYYYLDRSGRLVAKQQRLNFGGDLFGEQTSMINQIRYDSTSFNHNALTSLLTQSFGAKATPAMDGNAWLAAQRAQEDRLAEGRYARYSYEDSADASESEYDDDDASSEYERDEDYLERSDMEEGEYYP